MNSFESMYERFKLNEEAQKYLNELSNKSFSPKIKSSKISIETVINDSGKEELQKKEVIDAQLV